MKYIIGVLLGVVLMGAGTAFAANYLTISNPFAKIDDINSPGNVYKIEDKDNKTVCYTLFSKGGFYTSSSISCVK